jgi:hypothetical protein
MDDSQSALRKPLTRLSREEWEGPRYFHPNGYVIERERRTWSERGREPGRHHDPPPALYWWSVYNHVGLRRSILAGKGPGFLGCVSDRPQPHGRDFDTLREARSWCDEHSREGWPS